MIVIDTAAGEAVVDFAADRFTQDLAAALDGPAGQTVGLIGETAPALLKAWHHCLTAGHVPVLLQQPTAKLSRPYWAGEIRQTVRTLGVARLICQDASCDPEAGVPVIRLDALAPPDPARATTGWAVPPEARLLQLSSGTTGHRKGVALAWADIERHVRLYDRVLGLTPDDCIVSWLPLYHDMGLVAAFLAARILGCRLVLVDPMRWTREPAHLFALIERHGGTTCFMPNFAFEVMARHGRPGVAPTMRRWIACSEPTRAATLARFCDAIGTPPERLANCYGMAESVFAVAQSRGLRPRAIDGETVLSCGPPIPGTAVKLVDGEIFIRSEQSIRAYADGAPVVDAEGYYASGDLGVIVDGEIYLTGRRHDVAVQAGRKLLLSDLDMRLDAARTGRVAALGIADPALGTDSLVGLVEDAAYWRRNRDGADRAALAQATGVESAQIHFVPPRFITKTSSGKVNRRVTAAHWTALQAARAAEPATGGAAERLRREIRDCFPGLDLGRPVAEQLDSLGLVTLQLILSRDDPGAPVDLARSVEEHLAALGGPPPAETAVYKIVSLCDLHTLSRVIGRTFRVIGNRYGLPLQLHHVCAPIAKVLLSDLVFTDCFMARDDRFADEAARREAYAGVLAIHRLLRDASLLLVDDVTQLDWAQAYPQLSHDFRAAPEAALIGLRWARYASGHHRLACEVVRETPAYRGAAGGWIDRLADHLGIPVIKLAFRPDATADTQGWDVACRLPMGGPDGPAPEDTIAAFGEAFVPALDRTLARAMPRRGARRQFFDTLDPPHWCSWAIRREQIDFILERYRDILVLGARASVPYLAEAAARRGCRVTWRGDLRTDGDHDCVVQLGSWGRPRTDKPLFVLISAGWTDQCAHNVPDDVRAACPPLDQGLSPA